MSAPAQPGRSFGRVVGASIIGTTVEWYDFFLYGSAAALVFPALFFPDQSESLAGTLLSFGTYAVGFAARPIGALVFGHFGDRIGRKKLLVISLLMMGGSTFAIGLLPTFATVGVLAPLLLVTLRLIQGFALGGEWGGAVLLVSEHGKPENRGFWASWPQAGAPAGNLLATGVLALLGGVPVRRRVRELGLAHPVPAVGRADPRRHVRRLSVTESPVFVEAQRLAAEKAAETGVAEKAPILDGPRPLQARGLVAMGARIAENVSFYVLTAFSLTYLTKAQGADVVVHPERPRRRVGGAPGGPSRCGVRCPTGSAAGRSTCSGPSASACGPSPSSGCSTRTNFCAECLRDHRRTAVPRRDVRPAGCVLRRAVRHQTAATPVWGSAASWRPWWPARPHR